MIEKTESKRGGGRLGWFALGAILGIVIALGVMMARGKIAPSDNEATIRAVVQQEISAIDFKGLAKQGVHEALREDQQQAGIMPTEPAPQAQQVGVQVPLGDNILGDANAKVTLIEYSDFQ